MSEGEPYPDWTEPEWFKYADHQSIKYYLMDIINRLRVENWKLRTAGDPMNPGERERVQTLERRVAHLERSLYVSNGEGAEMMFQAIVDGVKKRGGSHGM
jgi:hypothetical protein